MEDRKAHTGLALVQITECFSKDLLFITIVGLWLRFFFKYLSLFTSQLRTSNVFEIFRPTTVTTQFLFPGELK